MEGERCPPLIGGSHPKGVSVLQKVQLGATTYWVVNGVVFRQLRDALAYLK